MLLGASPLFVIIQLGWPQKWELCGLVFAEEIAPGARTLLDCNQGMRLEHLCRQTGFTS